MGIPLHTIEREQRDKYPVISRDTLAPFKDIFGKTWAFTMSDFFQLSFSEQSFFEADITEPELHLSPFSSRGCTAENNQALNKSLEMAFGEKDRLNSTSPDSGIEMGNFEFDIEGCSALLSGNDPNLNNGPHSPAPAEKSITGDSEINTTELLVPVVTYNSQKEVDTITYMDSSDDEENKDDLAEHVSDTKNVSINPTSAIHSYSVLKPNNKRTMKSKKPANFNNTRKAVRTLISKGQQFSVPVSRRKRKLYELEPLCDPVAEKNRQNALNAKKKAELQEAAVEIDRLREENEDLRSESDNYRDQLEAARRELDMLKQMYKASNGALPPCLDDPEE